MTTFAALWFYSNFDLKGPDLYTTAKHQSSTTSFLLLVLPSCRLSQLFIDAAWSLGRPGRYSASGTKVLDIPREHRIGQSTRILHAYHDVLSSCKFQGWSSNNRCVQEKEQICQWQSERNLNEGTAQNGRSARKTKF